MQNKTASRRPGPTPISPPCARSSNPWAFRSIGRARSRPAIPAYYKHQQKMFLDFLAAGLVDRKKAKVNWDPVDHTVLANEQVIDGRGWRSGALVEQRELTQWFLKISASCRRSARGARRSAALAGESPADAEELDRQFRRPASALRACADGRSRRANSDVYTTRPDTLFGAKFIALAPDHPLAADSRGERSGLAAFIAECQRIGTSVAAHRNGREEGLSTPAFGSHHPFDLDWPLPVYVANFVLMDYGTGAIFGCPAHDQRDLDFANAYGLGNIPVVCPPDVDPATFASPTRPMTATAGSSIRASSMACRIEQRKKKSSRRLESAIARQCAGRQAPSQLSSCATGAFHASAIGAARSRSSIAKIAASCLCRKPICRSCCPRRHLRPARQPARPPPDLETCRLPAMRQARRGAKPTRWTRSSIRPGISLRFTDPWNKASRRRSGGR